jgi:hypothetical protein
MKKYKEEKAKNGPYGAQLKKDEPDGLATP